MKIGKNLIKARNNKNLSQQEVAEALGVSKYLISEWEKDASTPNLTSLMKLCRILDVTPNDILL